ncbi:NADH-quinone oxidoreductase subunit M [bacterium DOLJORAL78_65_58]|nr:MAG: NADH-quinone oxidoreductase subunit M [bacterium DOLZORAL124_64_63]PIE75990.1 MAG: NADH-quinone oxidoreductase subunit M [bacterium DOLJORAL78_65_58]
MNEHILSLVTFVPLLGALALWTVVRKDSVARVFALAVALVDFVLSLHLWYHYDAASGTDAFVEKVAWLFNGQVSYHMGMDGISLVLAMLTTFLGPIVILSTWKAVTDRVSGFLGLVLMLQAAMLGTFFARDMLLFYVFWEAMLIPMYFIIGIWGGQRRVYASVKFFIFTMVGSVFMLVAILYLYFQAGSMGLTEFMNVTLDPHTQRWLFAAFFVAFAIKVPLFPLHTWLPDAHVEAPTAGSVILAGVLLKMGTYGMLRFAMPLFPEGVHFFAPTIGILSVIGIIYGALVALVQPDVKKLVAYSSVSHLGFVVLGLFSLTPLGVAGGIFQMLAHGLSTGALFLLVGVIYERRHTREISEFGGLAHGMPVYATVFMIATLASVGLPGMAGFIGEFMILFGTFGSATLAGGKAMAILAATGVVLGAIYMLWMYQRVFLGKLSNEKNKNLPDLSLREIVVLAPIVVFIFWLGVRPGLILDKVEASIEHTLAPLTGQVQPAHDANHHHALLLDENRNEVLVIRHTENR